MHIRSVPIKGWMGATHFLTKRLPKVATEMALNVLAYNIKRVMAIIGVAALLEAWLPEPGTWAFKWTPTDGRGSATRARRRLQGRMCSAGKLPALRSARGADTSFLHSLKPHGQSVLAGSMIRSTRGK